MLYPVRRIVTGHNEKGQSVVLTDGLATNLVVHPTTPNRGLTNLWRTEGKPNNEGDHDPMAGPLAGLLPPTDGTVFRFFQVAPEKDQAGMTREEREARLHATFSGMGAPGARVDTARHPAMHKTETVDYIILLKGEVTMLLDDGEVQMKPFDVLVQRGTNHAWVNYGDEPAMLVAVLIDAIPTT